MAGPWRKSIILLGCLAILPCCWILLRTARPGGVEPGGAALRELPSDRPSPGERLAPPPGLPLSGPSSQESLAARIPGAAGAPGTGVATNQGGAPLDWIVRGQVVLEGGGSEALPIVELRLEAHAGYAPTSPFTSAVVRSSPDGAIQWALADPDRTVVICATVEDVPGYRARVEREHLALLGEGPVTNLRVVLRQHDAWLEGTVRASATPGAPIEGARIQYVDESTTTDARGFYRLRVPSRGYGSLIATAEGFQRGGETPGGLDEGKTTRVDIVLDPELGAEGRVYGYVRDSAGALLPGASVRCDAAREEVARTDATGFYELAGIRLGADAATVVVASCAGWARSEAFVYGPPEGERRPKGTQLDFTLQAGSTVEGAVQDADGAAVRGALIWIGPHAGLVDNRRTHSDDDGRFLFENVAPGPTRLGAIKRGAPSHTEDLRVPEDNTRVVVDIQLKRALPLRGRVQNPGGEPLEGVVLRARQGDYGRATTLAAATLPDGSFVIPGAPRGTLEIRASRVGFVPTTLSHDHDGEELELTLEPAVTLTGQVIDAATGHPVEVFVVRLAPPKDESLGPWFQGIDGSWLFEGRSFSAVDGRWTSDGKDPIRAGAWTLVEVEAAGYEVLRVGPLQVEAGREWTLELTATDSTAGK